MATLTAAAAGPLSKQPVFGYMRAILTKFDRGGDDDGERPGHDRIEATDSDVLSVPVVFPNGIPAILSSAIVGILLNLLFVVVRPEWFGVTERASVG